MPLFAYLSSPLSYSSERIKVITRTNDFMVFRNKNIAFEWLLYTWLIKILQVFHYCWVNLVDYLYFDHGDGSSLLISKSSSQNKQLLFMILNQLFWIWKRNIFFCYKYFQLFITSSKYQSLRGKLFLLKNQMFFNIDKDNKIKVGPG